MSENVLYNKKILFISPSFFGYEKEIIKKLEEKGAHVVFIDDRPNNFGLTKALIRTSFGKRLLKLFLKRYFIKKLREQSHSIFDFVFVNTPEGFTDLEVLEAYKKQFYDTPFILYMWDSIKNRKKTEFILPYFDKKFSFDKEDCKTQLFEFRPLFYLDYFKSILQTSPEIDISFIGTLHSDRYNFVRNFFKSVEFSLKSYSFFYLQNRLLFIYYLISNKSFKNIRYKDISFTSLSFKSIAKIIFNSKVVLDIHHPNQSGLTMRTMEVLGAKRKLLTTNTDIINYDFFCKNNIQILNRENPTFSIDFFNLPILDIPKEVYFKYSIDGWVEEIFK